MADTINMDSKIEKAQISLLEDMYYFDAEPTEVKTLTQFTYEQNDNERYIDILESYEDYMGKVIEQLYHDYFGEFNGSDVCCINYHNARQELLKASRLKDPDSRIAYMKAYVKTLGKSSREMQLRRAVYTNVFNMYLIALANESEYPKFLEYVYYED